MTPTNTQPRFHYWRDASECRWVIAVIAMAGIGWLVVGAARMGSSSQKAEALIRQLLRTCRQADVEVRVSFYDQHYDQ